MRSSHAFVLTPQWVRITFGDSAGCLVQSALFRAQPLVQSALLGAQPLVQSALLGAQPWSLSFNVFPENGTDPEWIHNYLTNKCCVTINGVCLNKAKPRSGQDLR
jgi:hypothetical protein